MPEYLAHSAKNDRPPQTYAEHITDVCEQAVTFAEEAEKYMRKGSGVLVDTVKESALLHDLGKLDDKNQKVLRGECGVQSRLPVNHTDAGCAALVNNKELYAALAVYSHHKGLPDMADEQVRGRAIFRDENKETREYVDASLEKLLQRHGNSVDIRAGAEARFYDGNQQVFFRMLLSCLADADHSDTARAYGQLPECKDPPLLRAAERLEALDKYVENLGDNNERSRLRRMMYSECRGAEINGGFSTCDSPVGSGKTTAVMAHLLKQASERGARRIFVVLPYTSIIKQSVDVYRKALTLSGEKSEEVVAELHCRADFQSDSTRYLTALWRAPIIVTTAVAFFETMASNRPSALRRFHELPGSMIFIDEAHNALPLRLLPLAWRWMNVMAEEWSCYWVLASGSLVRFWQLDRLTEIDMPQPDVGDLVRPELKDKLSLYESGRVTFRNREEPLSRSDLTEWVQRFPGPRLLILNTVQSAAVAALDICKKYGRECVEHLSTALTAEDREAVIEKIKRRLCEKDDNDWTLVATSCVEAGVDFSFRTGFREMSSLLSLLQAGGRVNRHGIYNNSEMWNFTLMDDTMMTNNPALNTSREVLRSYFAGNIPIKSELSTRSMNDEIIRDDSCTTTINRLLKHETNMSFRSVAKEFKVIDSDTVTVVVDDLLANDIANGWGDWKQLQRKSVSIRRSRIKSWNMVEIAEGVYRWTLGYDEFLGYMKGVLGRNEPLIY